MASSLHVDNSLSIPGVSLNHDSVSSNPNRVPGLHFMTPQMLAILQDKMTSSMDFLAENPDIVNYNELDNWYYAQIAQYKDNPELYNLLLNNPHLVGNSGKFSPSVYDNAASLLGSSAAEDRYYAQLRSDAVEYMNSLVGKYYDRKYESADQQVARLRSAGQNVDLNGGSSVSPGDSGPDPFSQKDSALPFDASNAASQESLNILSFVTEGVMSAITSTFDFIGRVNQFQLQNNELASGELEGLSSADSWLTSMLSKYIRYDYSKGYSKSDWAKSMSDALTMIPASLEFNNLSRRTRKWVKAVSDNYSLDNVSSLALYEKLQNEYLTAREKNVRIKSNPNYNEDFDKWMENITPLMSKFVDAELGDYESRIKNPKLIDSQIFHYNASGRESDARAALLKYRKEKIDTIGSLFDNIKASIPSDASWRGIAVWFTEMARVMVIQGLIKE